MKRKIMLILCTMMMVLALTGCGKGKEIIKIEYGAAQLLNMNYKEVEELLRENGFTNFVFQPIETKEIGEENRKCVTISIGDVKNFEEKDKFHKDDEIVISYWAVQQPDLGPNVQSILPEEEP